MPRHVRHASHLRRRCVRKLSDGGSTERSLARRPGPTLARSGGWRREGAIPTLLACKYLNGVQSKRRRHRCCRRFSIVAVARLSRSRLSSYTYSSGQDGVGERDAEISRCSPRALPISLRHKHRYEGIDAVSTRVSKRNTIRTERDRTARSHPHRGRGCHCRYPIAYCYLLSLVHRDTLRHPRSSFSSERRLGIHSREPPPARRTGRSKMEDGASERASIVALPRSVYIHSTGTTDSASAQDIRVYTDDRPKPINFPFNSESALPPSSPFAVPALSPGCPTNHRVPMSIPASLLIYTHTPGQYHSAVNATPPYPQHPRTIYIQSRQGVPVAQAPSTPSDPHLLCAVRMAMIYRHSSPRDEIRDRYSGFHRSRHQQVHLCRLPRSLARVSSFDTR